MEEYGMSRIDNVLKNCKNPKEILVVNVSKKNLSQVIALETTAVVTSPKNLNQYKNIVVISDKKVVAVATIKNVSDYDSKNFSNVWENNGSSWRSEIQFENMIFLGQTVENTFGENSSLNNIQTVMKLQTQRELDYLIKSINTFYLLHINSTLATIGIY
jgi:hypothetical protein